MMRIIEWLSRKIGGRKNGVPGVFVWLMAGVRRRLLVAGAFLLLAPTVLGAFLWKAATLEKEYTAEVPLIVSDYGHERNSIEDVLDGGFQKLVGASLIDSDEFLSGHRWQKVSTDSSIKQRFVSVLTTTDVRLATETHRGLVADFAAWADDRYPGLRFSAGDEIAAANSLVVDDSAIRKNTRLSLVLGGSAYALGLTLLLVSIAQIGWRFG